MARFPYCLACGNIQKYSKDFRSRGKPNRCLQPAIFHVECAYAQLNILLHDCVSTKNMNHNCYASVKVVLEDEHAFPREGSKFWKHHQVDCMTINPLLASDSQIPLERALLQVSESPLALRSGRAA